eukprot:gene2875-2106_t
MKYQVDATERKQRKIRRQQTLAAKQAQDAQHLQSPSVPLPAPPVQQPAQPPIRVGPARIIGQNQFGGQQPGLGVPLGPQPHLAQHGATGIPSASLVIPHFASDSIPP